MHPRGTFAGAWIYYRNSYKECARPYVPYPWPPNPFPTGRALAVRQLTALWHTLSRDEQQAWRPYARLYTLPCYTAFIKYNMRRFAHGLSFQTSPPN